MMLSDQSQSLEADALRIAHAISNSATISGVSIATAESCTGGLLSHLLTSVPGASHWYRGGIVAYTLESKAQLLHIPYLILEQGLVTASTAQAMATGAATAMGADYSISTTGVCGPEGSEGYMPTTAWIGLRTPTGTITSELVQTTDYGRSTNKLWVALQALTLLHRALTTKA